MDRRGFLAAVGAGLAGCVSAPRARRSAGLDPPVPRQELTRGTARDAIPAITEPAFGDDWSGVEMEARFDVSDEPIPIHPRLTDADPVIGVERDGEARAYPLRVLNWHEVVNDEFGGPLLVTYCPLCASGVTARRVVDGEPAVFGVSGLLFRSNLVLYDRPTGSLWSQLAARAIRGPMAGERLELVPSTLTTWGAWRDAQPGTRVLRPPPESGTVSGRVTRNYTVDPYAGYAGLDAVGVGENPVEDDRLHPKAVVVGVEFDGEARAYPLDALLDAGVINDSVGGRPMVAAVGPAGETPVAYRRAVDGTALAFEPDGPGHMRAGGSRWRIVDGRAVSGPYEGATLRSAGRSMFWFAWADFHPGTGVYRG